MNRCRSATIEIKHLEPDLIPQWEEFVETHPQSTFFHRAGWKQVIQESFGHRCYYLYATRGERILGVLPLTHIKSRLFGSALISNAFCVYGGPVTWEVDASDSLTEAAMELSKRLNVDYLEYRSCRPSNADWQCNSQLYATFRGPIHANSEKALLAIPRKRRAEIRKSLSEPLKSDQNVDVRRFYRIYAESVRNLGTPVFDRRYFDNLVTVFRPHCDILTVTYEGIPVSSVLSFFFRDTVLPYYGGSVSGARGLRANDYMYWTLMRRAADRGVPVFDFGRSKRGTGAFAYKKNWGFQPESLYHEYPLMKRADIPAVNPLNPKFRPLIQIWQHLPLGLANLMGPRIARNLG